jgi:MSHA biogenesis protein MshI
VDNHIMNSQEWEGIRERLVLEIQRSLDYCQSQMVQSMVPRIVVAPRAANSDILAQELGMAMAMDVVCMNIPDFLDCPTGIDPVTQQSCMLSIGAALRQEQGARSRKLQKVGKAA